SCSGTRAQPSAAIVPRANTRLRTTGSRSPTAVARAVSGIGARTAAEDGRRWSSGRPLPQGSESYGAARVAQRRQPRPPTRARRCDSDYDAATRTATLRLGLRPPRLGPTGRGSCGTLGTGSARQPAHDRARVHHPGWPGNPAGRRSDRPRGPRTAPGGGLRRVVLRGATRVVRRSDRRCAPVPAGTARPRSRRAWSRWRRPSRPCADRSRTRAWTHRGSAR
ncbi:MAG: hypothetical protein JWM12_2306, partial [Ilumatobacteraceae bacterium]|nr:hypothetical protein [Ilumatobacteraceae bacterium]